jgi:hypothetical protein
MIKYTGWNVFSEQGTNPTPEAPDHYDIELGASIWLGTAIDYLSNRV